MQAINQRSAAGSVNSTRNIRSRRNVVMCVAEAQPVRVGINGESQQMCLLPLIFHQGSGACTLNTYGGCTFQASVESAGLCCELH